MISVVQALISVLREARGNLARPDNDVAWSSREGPDDALGELDGLIGLIGSLEGGQLPPRLALTVLFAPTGPIQEVSLSSGWGDEFLVLRRVPRPGRAARCGSGCRVSIAYTNSRIVMTGPGSVACSTTRRRAACLTIPAPPADRPPHSSPSPEHSASIGGSDAGACYCETNQCLYHSIRQQLSRLEPF